MISGGGRHVVATLMTVAVVHQHHGHLGSRDLRIYDRYYRVMCPSWRSGTWSSLCRCGARRVGGTGTVQNCHRLWSSNHPLRRRCRRPTTFYGVHFIVEISSVCERETTPIRRRSYSYTHLCLYCAIIFCAYYHDTDTFQLLHPNIRKMHHVLAILAAKNRVSSLISNVVNVIIFWLFATLA